jgi:prophage antirepressor-like protein
LNEVTIFENPEFGKIRTMLMDGEPYFVGKDVAGILGYAKPENAVATHVDEDDTLKQGVIDGMGRTQKTTIINESGMYSLILGSKLPTAKKFKRWVTSEVLPSIRKTGSYSIQNKSDSYTIDDPIERAKRWIEEAEARKALESKIKEDEPKVALADKRLDKKGCLSITDATQSLNLKKGYITKWAKAKGFLHQCLTEVNKAGEKFFKVYSSDGIYNQIGITEDGLKLINDNIDEIRSINTKV